MYRLKHKNIFIITLLPFAIPSAYISFAFQFIMLFGLSISVLFTKRIKFQLIYAYFPLYFFLQLVSLLRSSSVSFDSFSEMMKPFAFFFAFFLGCSIDWYKASIFNHFYKPLLCIGSASILLGIVEYLGYTTPYSRIIDGRENLIGRFLGLFGTSYFASSIYLLIGILSLYLWRTTKTVGFFTISSLFFMGAFFTQSRTAFIAAFVFLVYFSVEQLFNSFDDYRLNKQSISFLFFPLTILTLCSIALVFLANKFSYILIGLFSHYLPNLLNQFSATSGSIFQRLHELRFVLTLPQSIIFGVSLEKPFIGSLESTYSYFLYHIGFIGFALYIYFLVCVYLRAKRLKNTSIDMKSRALFQGLSSYMLILPILSFASVITDQIRLFSVFYFFFGVCFSRIFLISPELSSD